MTKEEKDLLLRDLCARLPYGVKCNTPTGGIFSLHMLNPNEQSRFGKGIAFDFGKTYDVEDIKPYLRPMSSMTEEEKEEYLSTKIRIERKYLGEIIYYATSDTVDWLNAHHFDYRNLIDKDLALEAPEGMY